VVYFLCPDGGIGRRAGLKHQWPQPSSKAASSRTQ